MTEPRRSKRIIHDPDYVLQRVLESSDEDGKLISFIVTNLKIVQHERYYSIAVSRWIVT